MSEAEWTHGNTRTALRNAPTVYLQVLYKSFESVTKYRTSLATMKVVLVLATAVVFAVCTAVADHHVGTHLTEKKIGEYQHTQLQKRNSTCLK